jgi:glutamate racemase
VVRHILRRLPAEEVLYLADTAYAPYGEQRPATIRERVLAIGDYFVARGCKAVVLACNTATAAAVEALRAHLDLPVIAMEPALKPAAAITRSDVIAVLATAGTLASPRYAALRDRHGHQVEVLERVCHRWVAQVESGDLDSAAARALVAADLEPLLQAGADTLVLACTHFPFLAPLIRDVAGAAVELIDPSGAVVEHLARRLAELGLARHQGRGGVTLLATDPTRIRTAAVLRMLPAADPWSGVEV